MVNEFVLDDLSSSWTDSFYKNKTNSSEYSRWRHFHIHIYVYKYIYMKVALYIHIFSTEVKGCARGVKLGAPTVATVVFDLEKLCILTYLR